jgi:hypothetical protein
MQERWQKTPPHSSIRRDMKFTEHAAGAEAEVGVIGV